jgi:hypothetical protein
MCDYSLAGMPQRLARQGDRIVLHRFPAGTLGFASAQRRLREIFFPSMVTAVCIPPGGRLMLQDIPPVLQKRLGIAATEEVTLIQQTAEAFTHRDAVRFGNGWTLSLQELERDQRATVLSTDGEEPVHTEGPPAFRSLSRAGH